MTSLVPDLGKRQLHFLPIILRAGTEINFENYESVQHGLQYCGIKNGAKISFHGHFNPKYSVPTWNHVGVYLGQLNG